MSKRKVSVMQLDLFDSPRAKETKIGHCFKSGDSIYMRVKPINFILNSTLVQDVLVRGDIFVVNLSTGNMGAMKGATVVEQLEEAELHYKEKH